MRIETYVNGKHLASESPEKALANYLAFMAARYHPNTIDVVGVERSFAYMIQEYFVDWFEDMVIRHEVHLTDLTGMNLYDQYLVTEESDSL